MSKQWRSSDPISDLNTREPLPTSWKIKPTYYKHSYGDPSCYGLDHQNQLWYMHYTPKDVALRTDLFDGETQIGYKGEVITHRGWAGVIMGGVAHPEESVCDYGMAIEAAEEEMKAELALYLS